MLSFQLLGPVSVVQDGQPLINFRSQKELALLAYLAHTGQTHPREAIATLLWDGRSTQQALSNLRTVLARVRKHVDGALVVTRKTIALTPSAYRQVDSAGLLTALDEFDQIDSAATAAALLHELHSYQGEFLAEFHLPDAALFDQWCSTTRAEIQRRVIAAFEMLGRYAVASAETQLGLTIAQRWLEIDPLDETAHTLLIRLLIEEGAVEKARAHYDRCTALLREELDVPPPAEMTALISRAQRAPMGIDQIGIDRVVIDPPADRILHNLPAEHDQFFGRIAEQRAINARLDQPWCRLVTLVGPGGIGKTRLAATIGRHRLVNYRDGVWLVELAEIDHEDDDIVEAVAVEAATALGLRLAGAAKPQAQLLDYLEHREMLLILDNFEHLLDEGIDIVLELVRRCDHVQILVTSREALRVRAEWAVGLDGLSVPADVGEETESDALDLFAARRAQQQLGAMSGEDVAATRQICRLVEGLPLAIELAAALTRDATPQAIAAELTDGFQALTTSLRDMPPRHRGLDVVFTMSWRTLPTTLQRVLARLSVFHGGFTADAAREIALAHPRQLDALVAKSLLQVDGATQRFRLHEVVRSFAAAQRTAADGAASAGEESSTDTRHLRYYLTLLAGQAEPLQRDTPQRSIALLEPEVDNIRTAWQGALTEQQIELLYAALTPLSIYYQLRGLAYEAAVTMENTLRVAANAGAAGVALAVRAGLESARFQIRLGRHGPARNTVEAAARLAQQDGDLWGEGMAYVLWGEALWRSGEYRQAENRLQHAREIAESDDSRRLTGWCHHHLGIINDIQGRYGQAHEHLRRAREAWQASDNVQALSGTLNSIALVYYNQGNPAAAQQALEEALTLCNRLDDRHRQGSLLNNLSILAMEQGNHLDAHHYLQFALDLATTTGNLTGQGEIYVNLGKNYLLMGKPDHSVEHLEQGLKIAEMVNARTSTATAMFNLGEAARLRNDVDQSASFYSRALTIAREDGLKQTECEVLIGLAELLGRHDPREAQTYAAEAVSLAADLQNPQLQERATALSHYFDVPADVDQNQRSP